MEKNGWWLLMHSEVRVCVYLTSLAFRRARLLADSPLFCLLVSFVVVSSSVSAPLLVAAASLAVRRRLVDADADEVEEC